MGPCARINIGRAYWPKSEQAQLLDHIVSTFCSLKELHKIHGFKILMVKESCAQLPENLKFKKLMDALDSFLAKFPGISYKIVSISEK